jgi:hypothetical protein
MTCIARLIRSDPALPSEPGRRTHARSAMLQAEALLQARCSTQRNLGSQEFDRRVR